MVTRHPGMGKNASLPKLVLQAQPYLISLKGSARPPLTVYWSINSVCNLYCRMCDVGTANHESNFFRNLSINGKLKEIPIDRYKSVIDEVAPYRPMISITSTEPLMYKPLPEAIAYTRHKGMEIAITTGGYTLPKKAEELVDAGLTRLNVSIDGPPGLHNEIRGRKDSFEQSTRGIALAKEFAQREGKKLEVLVNFTISNLNYHSLEAFYDSISEFPVDRINFSYMNFVTQEMADAHNQEWGGKYRATVNCLNDDTDPQRVDVPVLFEQIKAVRAKDDKRAAFLSDFTQEELRTFFYKPMQFVNSQRCMVNWFIAEIIASGEVIPNTRCYYIPFGNINERPFMEIWNGEKMQAWRRDLRKQGRFPACTRCDQIL